MKDHQARAIGHVSNALGRRLIVYDQVSGEDLRDRLSGYGGNQFGSLRGLQHCISQLGRYSLLQHLRVPP
jgi:hypothetical protein